MFCPQCGEQIRQDVKFCPKCGTTINAKERTVKQQTPTDSLRKATAAVPQQQAAAASQQQAQQKAAAVPQQAQSKTPVVPQQAQQATPAVPQQAQQKTSAASQQAQQKAAAVSQQQAQQATPAVPQQVQQHAAAVPQQVSQRQTTAVPQQQGAAAQQQAQQRIPAATSQQQAFQRQATTPAQAAGQQVRPGQPGQQVAASAAKAGSIPAAGAVGAAPNVRGGRVAKAKAPRPSIGSRAASGATTLAVIALILATAVAWVIALVLALPGAVATFGISLEGALVPLGMLVFMVASLAPIVTALLSFANLVRRSDGKSGSSQKGAIPAQQSSISQPSRRVTSWAWACLVCGIAVLMCSIAFGNLHQGGFLLVFETISDAYLFASIIGVLLAALAVVTLSFQSSRAQVAVAAA